MTYTIVYWRRQISKLDGALSESTPTSVLDKECTAFPSLERIAKTHPELQLDRHYATYRDEFTNEMDYNSSGACSLLGATHPAEARRIASRSGTNSSLPI
jgi:hypothetical protein